MHLWGFEFKINVEKETKCCFRLLNFEIEANSRKRYRSRNKKLSFHRDPTNKLDEDWLLKVMLISRRTKRGVRIYSVKFFFLLTLYLFIIRFRAQILWSDPHTKKPVAWWLKLISNTSKTSAQTRNWRLNKTQKSFISWDAYFRQLHCANQRKWDIKSSGMYLREICNIFKKFIKCSSFLNW